MSAAPYCQCEAIQEMFELGVVKMHVPMRSSLPSRISGFHKAHPLHCQGLTPALPTGGFTPGGMSQRPQQESHQGVPPNRLAAHQISQVRLQVLRTMQGP